jgi:Flp pilus assembly pilin Flp
MWGVKRAMSSKVKNFFSDKSGAVTVDWVVLTAGLVLIPLAVVLTIQDSVTEAGTNISGKILAATCTHDGSC